MIILMVMDNSIIGFPWTSNSLWFLGLELGVWVIL